MRRTAKEKIKLFASLFRRLDKAYGTYEPNTGRHWQIKKPVTQETIYNHLSGSQLYGFYPLVRERTHVGVADFDDGNPEPGIQLVERARHYRIHAYLETVSQKGIMSGYFLLRQLQLEKFALSSGTYFMKLNLQILRYFLNRISYLEAIRLAISLTLHFLESLSPRAKLSSYSQMQTYDHFLINGRFWIQSIG